MYKHQGMRMSWTLSLSMEKPLVTLRYISILSEFVMLSLRFKLSEMASWLLQPPIGQ